MTDSSSELMALADKLYAIGRISERMQRAVAMDAPQSLYSGELDLLDDKIREMLSVIDRAKSRLAASQPDRDAVARAIAPDAFDPIDNPIFNRLDYDVDRTSSALDAADRVCLLLSGEVVQKSDGGVEGHAGTRPTVIACDTGVEKAATVAPEYGAGIKPGPSEPSSSTSETATANADLADRLERTTLAMARECKVGMGLWNGHSNACLNAVAVLRRNSGASDPAPGPDLREALDDILAIAQGRQNLGHDLPIIRKEAVSAILAALSRPVGDVQGETQTTKPTSSRTEASASETALCQSIRCLDERDVSDGVFLSKRMPASWSRMVVCATCGNKRCPHATNHRNACTNSNESGQVGSVYGIMSPVAETDAVAPGDAGGAA